MKKLSLNRETIRNLTDEELGRAVGGKPNPTNMPSGTNASAGASCGPVNCATCYDCPDMFNTSGVVTDTVPATTDASLNGPC